MLVEGLPATLYRYAELGLVEYPVVMAQTLILGLVGAHRVCLLPIP